jgi:hypothetical protein
MRAFSIAHALSKECGLQPTTAQFWCCRRTAEQSDAIVRTEHAGGTWYTINLADEAQTPLASRSDHSDLKKEVQKFGMFVRPGYWRLRNQIRSVRLQALEQ